MLVGNLGSIGLNLVGRDWGGGHKYCDWRRGIGGTCGGRSDIGSTENGDPGSAPWKEINCNIAALFTLASTCLPYMRFTSLNSQHHRIARSANRHRAWSRKY